MLCPECEENGKEIKMKTEYSQVITGTADKPIYHEHEILVCPVCGFEYDESERYEDTYNL